MTKEDYILTLPSETLRLMQELVDTGYEIEPLLLTDGEYILRVENKENESVDFVLTQYADHAEILKLILNKEDDDLEVEVNIEERYEKVIPLDKIVEDDAYLKEFISMMYYLTSNSSSQYSLMVNKKLKDCI